MTTTKLLQNQRRVQMAHSRCAQGDMYGFLCCCWWLSELCTGEVFIDRAATCRHHVCVFIRIIISLQLARHIIKQKKKKENNDDGRCQEIVAAPPFTNNASIILYTHEAHEVAPAASRKQEKKKDSNATETCIHGFSSPATKQLVRQSAASVRAADTDRNLTIIVSY